MNLIGPRFAQSPLAARVVPFAVFIGLTFCQDFFGDTGRYWIYLAKTLLGAWLIVVVRPAIAEMRWKLSWEAVAVGVAVFVMWVGLPGLLKWLGSSGSFAVFNSARAAWNPTTQFAGSPALAWLFIGGHIGGSALVVPPLEEVFYRSFLYRYRARNHQRLAGRVGGVARRVALLVIPGKGCFALWPWLNLLCCWPHGAFSQCWRGATGPGRPASNRKPQGVDSLRRRASAGGQQAGGPEHARAQPVCRRRNL